MEMKIGKIKPWRELLDQYDVDENGDLRLYGEEYIVNYDVWKALNKRGNIIVKSSRILNTVDSYTKYRIPSFLLDGIWDSSEFKNSPLYQNVIKTNEQSLLSARLTRDSRLNVLTNELMWGSIRGFVMNLFRILQFVLESENVTWDVTVGGSNITLGSYLSNLYSYENKLVIIYTLDEAEADNLAASLAEHEIVSFNCHVGNCSIYTSTEEPNRKMCIGSYLDVLNNLLDIIKATIPQTDRVLEILSLMESDDLIPSLLVILDEEKAKENEEKYAKFAEKASVLLGDRIREQKKDELDQIKDQIAEMETALGRLYLRLRDQEIQVYWSNHIDNTAMNEMIICMRGSGAIDPRVEGDKLIFTIITDLINFNDDDWEKCKDGYFDTNFDSGYEREFKVFDNIFTRKWTLIMEEKVVLHTTNGNVRSLTDGDGRPYYHGVPNPHHEHYDCWGDNKSKIKSAFLSCNYVNAYMQIVSAVGGVNITENVTMNHFFNDLKGNYYDQVPCIRLETGEVVTLSRAKEIAMEEN